jgi:hypothetical protein
MGIDRYREKREEEESRSELAAPKDWLGMKNSQFRESFVAATKYEQLILFRYIPEQFHMLQ